MVKSFTAILEDIKMVKIIMTDSVIRQARTDGISVNQDGSEVEITLTRSLIEDVGGHGIIVRPSTKEFLDAGINPSVSNEMLLKARQALIDVDSRNEKTVFKRLAEIGFTEYLSAAANLVTVAQFILSFP